MIAIAGGGPNGLMLACELALAGLRPVVLEKLAERSQEPKANGMVGQVVRLLHHRGLHERLGGGETPFRTPGYMFGMLPLDLSAVPDNPLTILPVPQHRIEQVLEERALELGVEIRRGHEVTGFTQDDSGVHVRVLGPRGVHELSVEFLVGADGGRSTVRKLAGIGFPGVSTEKGVVRVAHVSLPERVDGNLEVPGHGPIPPGSHVRTEHGVFMHIELEQGKPLVMTVEWDPADDLPMTLDELRQSIHRVLGADVPVGPPRAHGPHMLRRTSGGNTRIAEKYRRGRVFLIGDAAHVHSAMGGPGLNLGLQDAANLGWKLAGHVHGWAPPGLLDTYEAERRPAAERVVVHTQAQTALTGPGPEVTALRTFFAELMAGADVATHIAETMAGADIRYPTGANHPLAGRFLPDWGPVSLLSQARPLLLDLTRKPALRDIAAEWADRVDVVELESTYAHADALLVRPDGYVAWAGDGVLSGLREELAAWFGSPRILAAVTN
ncbi:FAD-dependent monooxygenase [Kibdelosporangium phytohabitans]|uniref:FAD-dependent oxidoreductase n=1 Tax=Kibdelosporangium phytohabitans TaxID=860235 RepID=A0A0N9IFA6_9PSEU|nr:FAD-dependent monooxygenase [Kibdelosporangium phytohabitans]ALG13483.1 FAD-dependent oxidoreductase [Kibdelosporangium phytohabitans]MBE1465331.1 2-polyprenyl-6-methoxyphenol hydroxylase-like FAD-dependent oxidoreductase [Kibdelosporangium phytohabitans]